MKNKFFAIFIVFILALSGAFSINVLAQTTEEGPGPSDQPSAPMEMGQSGPTNDQPSDDQTYDDHDAQPTEAQPGGPSGEAAAQTDQGVARVSLMRGDVSTQRGDSGDWSAVVLNQPVMTGDKISTGDNSRAELQLDFANTLRLGPNSRANLANLTHKQIQIQLGEGIADFVVSKDSEAEPEIDTPNISIHPSHHDGVFRVEVRPDGDTIVIVRKGEAQIATPEGSTEVREGDMATVRGDSSSAQYKISQAPDRDDWDRWNSDRDHVIRDANSWRHTNRRYTGTQDLDAYGNWQNVPDYGDVWVPNEPDGWVPYRNGNWVYEPYYGWTWVGYEPWGWAPYHYGRWFPYGSSWAWWPGPVYAGYNPFWSPAYVSFFGWGGGFGFGVGFGGWGGFGWLPIGPCDFFHPWWGGYRGRFGVVNVYNVHNNYRYGGIRPLHGGNRFSNIANLHNDHVGRALSTVNAGRFGAGRVSAVAANREQIRGARMMAGNLPVVPSRASLSASGRAAAPSTIRNGGSQRFFGSAHNNVARPVSFQQQTATLRQTMQQNRVGAVPAGGRTAQAAGFRAPAASSNMQRPSAGTLANRQMNNPGNQGSFNRGSVNQGSVTQGSVNQPSAVQNGSRGGYRPFTPSNNNRPSTFGGAERGNVGSNPNPRSTGNTQSLGSGARPPANHGGFRPFNPPSGSSRSSGVTGADRPNMGPSGVNSRSMESPRSVNQPPASNGGGFRPFPPPSRNDVQRSQPNMPSSRSSNGGYWNRTAPSSVQPRGNSSYPSNYGRGSSSRPQLDMRQPIVRPPSSSRPSGPSYGGPRSSGPSYSTPRSAPSYSAPRGGPSYSPRSMPSYGGSRGGTSYSAPRSMPSYGGGGGHSSAPSAGGHYSGGGSGHVSSGGGGHSSSGSGHSGRR